MAMVSLLQEEETKSRHISGDVPLSLSDFWEKQILS